MTLVDLVSIAPAVWLYTTLRHPIVAAPLSPRVEQQRGPGTLRRGTGSRTIGLPELAIGLLAGGWMALAVWIGGLG